VKSGIGRKALAFVGGGLMLVGIGAATIQTFRRSNGPYREIDGVIESFGVVPTRGWNLRGANLVIASVRLANGNLVSAYVTIGTPLPSGSRVLLREYPQNFGQPEYSVVAQLSRHEP
jgi:hypothetical protein